MDIVAWFEIIFFPIEEEAAGSTMDSDIREIVDTRKYCMLRREEPGGVISGR